MFLYIQTQNTCMIIGVHAISMPLLSNLVDDLAFCWPISSSSGSVPSMLLIMRRTSLWTCSSKYMHPSSPTLAYTVHKGTYIRSRSLLQHPLKYITHHHPVSELKLQYGLARSREKSHNGEILSVSVYDKLWLTCSVPISDTDTMMESRSAAVSSTSSLEKMLASCVVKANNLANSEGLSVCCGGAAHKFKSTTKNHVSIYLRGTHL